MILEHALINVREGQESEFEAAYDRAQTVLASTPGYRSHALRRGIEHPGRYLLLVEWESIEDHLQNFRKTERFTEWRSLIGPYFDGPPEVDHFGPLGGPDVDR